MRASVAGAGAGVVSDLSARAAALGVIGGDAAGKAPAIRPLAAVIAVAAAANVDVSAVAGPASVSSPPSESWTRRLRFASSTAL